MVECKNCHLARVIKRPLLNFEWVTWLAGCWFLGVKGGRSPAKRTLDAKKPGIRWFMAGCSALVHPAMKTNAALVVG